MRLFVVVAIALFLAPPFAVADQGEPEDGIAVTVLRVSGKGVYATWSPAPAAIMYQVWRGPTLDDLTLLAQTPALDFVDSNPPDRDVWYQIVSITPQNGLDHLGPMKGSCLAVRGATGIAFTAASCMPAAPG